MSYILDAIRKSDQQRQRGATPTLRSVQAASVAPEPRARWVYPVLATMLAVAAFGIGWLRPWQADAPAARADTVAVQSPDAVPAAPATPTAAAPSPAAPSPSQPASPASPVAPPPPSPHPAAIALATKDVLRARVPATPADSAKPAPQKPAVAENASTAAPHEEKTKDEKLLMLAELPASVRQELPSLTITVHAYSRTPKDRLVGVNDKLLHEGDAVAPDLVLEKITPDGMVFSYKGVRFQRGVQ